MSEEGHSVYGGYDPVITMENETWYFANMTEYNDTSKVRGVTHPPRGTDRLQLFRYVCEVGLAFPLAMLGLLGNILAMVVLYRHKKKLTTTVILLALALADTMVLLATVSVRSTRYLFPMAHYHELYHYLFRWMYPAAYFFRLTDTWLTVLLTVDRYIAVCHPLRANRLCSLSRTYFLLFTIVIVSCIFSVPRFFEWQMTSASHPDNNITRTFAQQTGLTEGTFYNTVYRIFIFFLVMYLVPMTTLIALNSILWFTLRQASIQSASLQLATHSNTNNRNNRSVTLIVITVVLVCIACNTCAMVAHILWSIPMAYKHLGPVLDLYRRYISNVSNVLVTLNSSINFIIYCICSLNFRIVLKQIFNFGNRQRGGQSPLPEGTSLLKHFSSGSDQTQAFAIRSSLKSGTGSIQTSKGRRGDFNVGRK